MAESKNTDKELFSTCFEFGTIGDEFFDTILSLKYTVDENRNHWYPTKNTFPFVELCKYNYTLILLNVHIPQRKSIFFT